MSKKKRRRFTIQEKLCFIRNVKKRLENGLSQRAACEELNIHHTLYSLWIKQLEEMRQSKEFQGKESLPRSSVLACTNTGGASTLHL
jgi:transposase-like protein